MGYSDYDDMLERDRKRGNKGHGHPRMSGMHEGRRGDKGSTVGIIAAICILVCLLILLIVLLVTNGDSSETEQNPGQIENVVDVEEISTVPSESVIIPLEEEPVSVEAETSSPNAMVEYPVENPVEDAIVEETTIETVAGIDIMDEEIPTEVEMPAVDDVVSNVETVPAQESEPPFVEGESQTDIDVEPEAIVNEQSSTDVIEEDGASIVDSIEGDPDVVEPELDGVSDVDVPEDEILVASNDDLESLDEVVVAESENVESLESELASEIEEPVLDAAGEESALAEIIEQEDVVPVDDTFVVEPETVVDTPSESVDAEVMEIIPESVENEVDAEVIEIMPEPVVEEDVAMEAGSFEYEPVVAEPVYTLAESSIAKYGINIKASSDGVVNIQVSNKVNYKDALSLAMKLKNTTNYNVVVKGRDIMIEIGDELLANSNKAIEKLRSVISSTMRNLD